MLGGKSSKSLRAFTSYVHSLVGFSTPSSTNLNKNSFGFRTSHALAKLDSSHSLLVTSPLPLLTHHPLRLLMVGYPPPFSVTLPSTSIILITLHPSTTDCVPNLWTFPNSPKNRCTKATMQNALCSDSSSVSVGIAKAPRINPIKSHTTILNTTSLPFVRHRLMNCHSASKNSWSPMQKIFFTKTHSGVHSQIRDFHCESFSV